MRTKKFISQVGKVGKQFVVDTKKFAQSPGVNRALTGFRHYSEEFGGRVEHGITPKIKGKSKKVRLF
jgi:hypothetical protein